MDFLKKFFGAFSAASPKRAYAFSVKCNRCGEVISARVDLDNDLSVEYGEGGDIYYARKVLTGEKRCFQRVEVELKFNAKRELLERSASGGEFVA